MYTKDDINHIKKFINNHPDANIILASDSQRAKKKKVRFVTVVIIHYKDENGIGKGAKIFTDTNYEKISDGDLSRPYNRMMREVSMVTELYEKLEDVLILRDFEIHIDVNSDPNAGSHIAYNSAKWTIFGLTGIEPVTKPYAYGASCVADHYTK